AALVTLGDPGTLTGGFLVYRRLAELAPAHASRLEFTPFSGRPVPPPILDSSPVLREIERMHAGGVVLDSMAAAFMAMHRPAEPMLGMLHQPPGGIDHGPLRTRVQAALDRQAYKKLRCLMVASESLGDELRRGGEP